MTNNKNIFKMTPPSIVQPTKRLVSLNALRGFDIFWIMSGEQILAGEYIDGPGGLGGNDDAGQMSAWYMFASMGFIRSIQSLANTYYARLYLNR
jgi:hypothetical protein